MPEPHVSQFLPALGRLGITALFGHSGEVYTADDVDGAIGLGAVLHGFPCYTSHQTDQKVLICPISWSVPCHTGRAPLLHHHDQVLRRLIRPWIALLGVC